MQENMVIINGEYFFRHHTFNDYGANMDGIVRRISTGLKPRQRYKMFNGDEEFLIFLWFKDGNKKSIQHRYLKKRFIYEAIYGYKINETKKILEYDGVKHNLSIENLYIE